MQSHISICIPYLIIEQGGERLTIREERDIYIPLNLSRSNEMKPAIVSVRYLIRESLHEIRRLIRQNQRIALFLRFFSCSIIEGYHTILTYFPTPRRSGKRNLLTHGQRFTRLARISNFFNFLIRARKDPRIAWS